MGTVKIVQTDEPVAAELIAASIVKIADGMDRIRRSGLNQRALVLLLSDSCGVTRTDVRRVLDGLDTLKRDYCSTPQKPTPNFAPTPPSRRKRS